MQRGDAGGEGWGRPCSGRRCGSQAREQAVEQSAVLGGSACVRSKAEAEWVAGRAVGSDGDPSL